MLPSPTPSEHPDLYLDPLSSQEGKMSTDKITFLTNW
jgi:hypothetical protein